MLELYRALIALRQTYPEIRDSSLDGFTVDAAADDSWLVMHRGRIRVVCNVGSHDVTISLDGPTGDVLLAGGLVDVQTASVRLRAESFTVVRL